MNKITHRWQSDQIVSDPKEVPSPRYVQVVYWEDGTAQISIIHNSRYSPKMWLSDVMNHDEIEHTLKLTGQGGLK
jgi:hypothetical protein